MSNQEKDQEPEDIETIVWIPDEGVYGTVVKYGAWASMIEYYYGGVSYRVELPNEEFQIVDELGVGYLDEEVEGIGYPEEEEEDYL
jgi:hypothetical protein